MGHQQNDYEEHQERAERQAGLFRVSQHRTACTRSACPLPTIHSPPPQDPPMLSWAWEQPLLTRTLLRAVKSTHLLMEEAL